MSHINIMTSCDNNLALYLLPQIASIAENLKKNTIDFYLLHYRIDAENIDIIKEYIQKFDNIKFIEVVVDDPERYEVLTRAGSGGSWPCEAYFSLCAHMYLPQSVERVLYIDAGDIIINGNIDEFYFDDFEGKSLIAAYPRILKPNGEIYELDDLSDYDTLRRVSNGGLLNSGSFIINAKKLRDDGLSMNDYEFLAQELRNIFSGEKAIWFGDQGFISVAFAGDIKYFGYESFLRDGSYTPYNFGMWYATLKLSFAPKIIHYCDIGGYIKPWKARFDYNADLSVVAPYQMTKKHLLWHEIWWKFCEKTPIYDQADKEARAAAEKLHTIHLERRGEQ